MSCETVGAIILTRRDNDYATKKDGNIRRLSIAKMTVPDQAITNHYHHFLACRPIFTAVLLIQASGIDKQGALKVGEKGK